MTFWFLFVLSIGALDDAPASFTKDKTHYAGFFDLYWDDSAGDLYLAIPKFNESFIMVHSLATGLGSNDIGLDRGKLGGTRIVKFERVGKRVFLVEPNLIYRAESNNPAEIKAVAESFADATLWATDVAAEENGLVFVKLNTLAFSDMNFVADTLKQRSGGSYSLDKSLARFYLPRTKAFPDNTEIEASLTFSGKPKQWDYHLAGVVADDRKITLRQHLSFVRLPDDGYQKRPFHTGAGGFTQTWRDYAAPLDADLDQNWAVRHRLVPKNPKAKRSEAVEPIIYYVDSGAPKQIQDALIEGAAWWNQAFEAAGYINAFQVKVMPEDADPMDVRYNTIQWVHRSTRGWSYGASVVDPRTGEIIKGHVTLGSLRVRQDRLLFEGMIPRDKKGNFPKNLDPVELSLMRIRQLSAHEVGHTLGFAHNFISSAEGRASVMDYPAPLVTLKNGKLRFNEAYDVGIGAWDKVATICLYKHFEDPWEGMNKALAKAKKDGLHFIADTDSRSSRSMHPDSHLWDNGSNALDEMDRLIELRAHLLKNLSHRNLGADKVAARLEEVLVPVYLQHRFQLLAAAKNLGGARFGYAYNTGDQQVMPVAREDQERAMAILLETLEAEFLALPKHLQGMIPPRPPGFNRHRELFDSRTLPGFDALALAETSAKMTLSVLLVPERLNRLQTQRLMDDTLPGVSLVLDGLFKRFEAKPEGSQGQIHRQVNAQVLNALIGMVGNENLREEIRAEIYQSLVDLKSDLAKSGGESHWRSHSFWLIRRLEAMEKNEDLFKPSRDMVTPPGSPI